MLFYLTGATFKTSLYLFYFIMLICNALVSADPYFPILRYMTDYFKSVYYGILILFAADTFLSRLLDEVHEKRIKKLEAKLNQVAQTSDINTINQENADDEHQENQQ